MKIRLKILAVLGVLLFSGCLITACSGAGGAGSTEPPDLTGEWTQINSNSEDMYMVAEIDESTITVNWKYTSDDTTSLYWAGTYVAPTEAGSSYTWDSENDHEQTDEAWLSSGDDTKTFTYENDELSFDVSMMDETTTVRMERVASND